MNYSGIVRNGAARDEALKRRASGVRGASDPSAPRQKFDMSEVLGMRHLQKVIVELEAWSEERSPVTTSSPQP